MQKSLAGQKSSPVLNLPEKVASVIEKPSPGRLVGFPEKAGFEVDVIIVLAITVPVSLPKLGPCRKDFT